MDTKCLPQSVGESIWRVAQGLDGWHGLPCGGAVKIEDGLPVRLSDGATADEPGADPRRVLAEAIEYTGRRLRVREWQSAQGEPDATARVDCVEE